MKKYIPIIITSFISITIFLIGVEQKIIISDLIAKYVLSPYYEVTSIVPKIQNLKAKNQKLKKRCAELSYLNTQIIEAKIENDRLRKLLNFKPRPDLKMVPAEVITTNFEEHVSSIIISKGSESGINYSDPVITPTGIIGKVIEVMPDKSIVQLLFDRNCRISARVQRTRTSGIVIWEKGPYLSLEYVPIHSKIQKGDLIISSGLGGIFPAGLHIGKVISIEPEPSGLFLDVLIEPSANFSTLENTVVITGEK